MYFEKCSALFKWNQKAILYLWESYCVAYSSLRGPGGDDLKERIGSNDKIGSSANFHEVIEGATRYWTGIPST